MELILWRHADAEVGLDDLKRELTDKGRKQAARIAKWLKPRLEEDWKVLASPAVRARQTAEALERKIDIRVTLGIDASEDALLREVGWPNAGRNVIVVGHQPTLGRVAARLIHGKAGDISIRKGSIWWFSSRADEGVAVGETVLRAVIGPDLAD
jgi:phosphohistidine phosphatase